MKPYIRLFIISSVLLVLALSLVPLAAQDDARVRIGYFAFDPNEYDTYLDRGLASFSPGWSKVGWGVPLIFLPEYRADCATPYMTMSSGMHNLVITPAGKGVDAAILEEAITLEAGHSYSLAFIGEMDNLSLLTIDETEVFQGVDLDNNFISVVVHNVHGAPPVDVFVGEDVVIDDLEYGNWNSYVVAEEFIGSKTLTAEAQPVTLFELDPSGMEHGITDLTVLSGSYPGEVGKDIFWDFNWNYSGDVVLDSKGEITIGDVKAGAISAATHRDVYTLNLDAEMVVDVIVLGAGTPTPDSLMGDLFDPMLFIYDSHGNLLFWNDEGTGVSVHKGSEVAAFDAALQNLHLAPDVYSIQVAGFSDLFGGPYGLIVRETPGV